MKSYPYLAANSSLVVIFSDNKSGTCLVSFCKDVKVGEYRTDWDEDGFSALETNVCVQLLQCDVNIIGSIY